ncbi:MAG TPA: hypothetical protein VIU62_17745 [Chloroflexota bacterium]
MLTPTAALSRLEAWLETLRAPNGYGGPVVHWWGQCLRFTGAAADWRYEGIILGYLRLWERSRAEVWLDRACRAADDVLAQALPSGGYRYSSFELNPAPFGTPHEAACDVALLRLALALRAAGREAERAERFAGTAERNLELVYAGALWDSEAGGFRDVPSAAGFVPNKQATAAEAWLALAEWRRDAACAEQYALPALRLIVRAQQAGGHHSGAIDQILTVGPAGWSASGRYFPLYMARCLPALVAGAHTFQDTELAEAALGAATFINKQINPQSECPLIVYANGVTRRQPSWIAALGDILRGLAAAQTVGGYPPPGAVLDRLLAGQDSNGGIRTAHGFAAILDGRANSQMPELRDLLHVAGWADKAFRYLADVADPPAEPLPPTGESFEAACLFQGRQLHLLESPAELRLEHQGRTAYRWQRGRDWAWIGPAWLDLR